MNSENESAIPFNGSPNVVDETGDYDKKGSPNVVDETGDYDKKRIDFIVVNNRQQAIYLGHEPYGYNIAVESGETAQIYLFDKGSFHASVVIKHDGATLWNESFGDEQTFIRGENKTPGETISLPQDFDPNFEIHFDNED